MRSEIIIIAEAGVNHNGSKKMAMELIDAAARSGADIVKFQTFKADKIVSPFAKKAGYQVDDSSVSEESQLSMLKKLELSEEIHVELVNHCKRKGIQFLSTGFDEKSVDLLDRLGVNIIKIPSGEITNKPYLEYISKKGKPVIMSTGMAEMDEIGNAVEILVNGGLTKQNITVLHCNSAYPTPYHDVNLKAMQTIGKKFNLKVGYSDHTPGIEVAIAAAALGAKVIEKHFTLNRELPGPDHRASLEPQEFQVMVSSIRNIEMAISGDGIKKPTASEIPNIVAARKSIHLAKKIKKDEVITIDHLVMMRPGDGISPMDIDKVIGKKCHVDLPAGSKLLWEWIRK